MRGSGAISTSPLVDQHYLIRDFDQYDGTMTLASSVTDLDRSVDWFKDKLGLEERFRAPEAGWAEVTTPTENISIGLGINEEVDGKGGTTPVFGLVDIEAAKAELEGNGVTFDGDIMTLPGMVKLATFFDPDGNSYMLAQSLS